MCEKNGGNLNDIRQIQPIIRQDIDALRELVEKLDAGFEHTKVAADIKPRRERARDTIMEDRLAISDTHGMRELIFEVTQEADGERRSAGRFEGCKLIGLQRAAGAVNPESRFPLYFCANAFNIFVDIKAGQQI
jgi:hypothetical protein